MNPALHLVLWSWAGSIPCSAPAALAREQRSQRLSAKSYNVKTCSILSKTAVGKLNFIRSPMAAGLGGEEREVYISIKPFLCSIGQGKKRHQQNRGCLEGCRKTKKKEHTNNMLFKIKETLTPQETKLSSLVSLLTNALNSWRDPCDSNKTSVSKLFMWRKQYLCPSCSKKYLALPKKDMTGLLENGCSQTLLNSMKKEIP